MSLSLLFLFTDDEPLSITSTSSIHSYMKTSDTEYFHIQLLSNKKESVFFIEEGIVSSSITDNVEVIPLEVQEINLSETSSGSYIVDYTFKIGFHSEDYEIQLEEAFLKLQFQHELLEVYIGEFNYLFYEDVNMDLSLMNLEATYTELEGINTVSGLMITLRNNTFYNIVIKDISIFSKDVDVMNSEVFILYEDIDNFTEVSTILQKDFDPYDFSEEEITISIRNGETETLFAPVIFNGDIDYIHRFCMKITYLIGDTEYVYYIDDFPFMRENLFFSDYEEYHYLYTYDKD